MHRVDDSIASGLPICSIRANGEIVAYTGAFASLLGENSPVPNSIFHFVETKNYGPLIEDSINEQKLQTLHWRVRIDQENIPLKVSLVPCTLPSGEPGATLLWERMGINSAKSEVVDILSSINKNLQEGFYRTSEEGELFYVNDAMVRMFGFEDAITMRTKNSGTFYANPEQRIEFRNELVGEGVVTNRELLLKRRDGSIFWGMISAVLTTHEDGSKSFDGVIRDISSIKEIERQLKMEAQRAEAGSRAKQQFLSTMSHELRTPLNAVIGLAHLLKAEDPKEEQVENLNSLLFSAKGLLGLINDILDFSKMDAGRVRLESSHVDINSLLLQIRDTFIFQANAKRLSLNFQLDEATPASVLGDAHRLTQIFNNLISNSIKFTFHGEILLKTKVIEVNDGLATIHFSAKDSGIGIPESKLKSVFSLFTQASSSTTRKFGGTGLGLAITKKLVELHGADLEMVSVPGEGSEFGFTITFELPDEVNPEPIVEEVHIVQNVLHKKRILAAEDNKINQLLLEKFVTSWGAEVTIAENGLEVVERAGEEEYDLILMDIQMPLMDGYTAARKIRETEGANQHIPIIAVTASVMGEVNQRCKDAGMSGVVLKPYSPSSLKLVVERHLS